MSISELRRIGGVATPRETPGAKAGRDLVRAGVISDADAARARTVRRRCDTSIERILRAEGLAAEGALLAAHARRLRTRRLREADVARLEVAETGLDPRRLIRHAVLPCLDERGEMAAAVGAPEDLTALRSEMPGALDGVRLFLAPRGPVQAHLARHYRALLTDAASARVPASESCRHWGRAGARLAVTLACLALLAGLVLAFPVTLLTIFTAWAALTLVVSAVLKLAAFTAALAADPATQAISNRTATPEPPLPRVSILVPLFRETEVLHALIARLTRLTYPKCLLDVVLVLEEVDDTTRAALAGIDLPPWIRPVVVPDGQPRTKPRAMNYALDFCEGEIVGVLDAEDAPAPDQITRIARRFQTAPPDMVCLQGVLDYYNSRQNWIARCFTIEYATWFRRIMPGMAQLGFAIPLGGTTCYFRRDALERLGAWDAHNVTEDADLGFRMVRHGWRTEMIATRTAEEANCRPWPWVRQRSRWLKGYMTTWLVHMRRPRRLLRQLGVWKFLGFQAHFVTALSQFLLAPLLWSYWLVMLGLPHPIDAVLPYGWLVALGTLFLTVEAMGIAMHAAAVAGPGHRHLLPWVPTMHLYAPLGAVAAYKALYELAVKPFFWDKTAHGLSLRPRRPAVAGAAGQGAEPQMGTAQTTL